MASYTTNYNLIKPANEDFIDIGDLNDNADIIDSAILAEKEAAMEWAKGTFSNPNLLISGDFQVWQRGTVFTLPGYTADRWYLIQGGTTATREINTSNAPCLYSVNAVRTSTQGTLYLYQPLENHSHLVGKNLTLSFWLKGVGGFAGLYFARFGQAQGVVITLTDQWQHIIITGTGDFTTATSLNSGVLFYTSSTNLPLANQGIQVTGVKLEIGSVATPFVPRPYDEELASCKRYYQKIKYGTRIRAGQIATNEIGIYFPIQEMRTIPTLTMKGTQGTDYAIRTLGAVIQTGFTFASAAMTTTQLGIGATKTAHGLTDGQLVILTSVGEVELDAEIY